MEAISESENVREIYKPPEPCSGGEGVLDPNYRVAQETPQVVFEASESEIDDPNYHLAQETAQAIFEATTVVDVSGNVKPETDIEQSQDSQVGSESDTPVVMDTREQDFFEFGDMSSTYGPFQRGCIAKSAAPPGTVVLLEDAMIWVCAPLPEDLADDDGNFPEAVKLFFLSSPSHPNWFMLPKDLLDVLGGFHIALTALAILRQPFMANVFLGDVPDFPGLFGHHDFGNCCTAAEAYEIAHKYFFQPAIEAGKKQPDAESELEAPSERRARITATEEELAEWTVERFGRLYAVMQTNALKGYRPMDTELYGVGIFSAACFYNHSCNPNAVMHVQPGKVCIQLVRPVEAGDEITVAYKVRSPCISLKKSPTLTHIHTQKGTRC
jgi:hypothetical protein